MAPSPLVRVAFAALVWALVACGSDPVKSGSAGDSPGPSTQALATAAAIGHGDGSAESVGFVTVYEPADFQGIRLETTGLAWSGATADELWVTLREGYVDRTCNTGQGPCAWLEGRVAIVDGATGGDPAVVIEKDANAWHFMRRPTSIAWGAEELFATCGEARTGNYEDEAVPYNGPVLWTSDPTIFAQPPPPGANGTHIDMLHDSPYCMGIAHEVDNVFWVFNGDAGSLDRYDFHAPHEPGGEDHSDGELWRYADGLLLRVPEVPSHLVYDALSRLLYAADPGHGRVLALDTSTGAPGGEVIAYDPIVTHSLMTGARTFDAVPPGVVTEPSGLALQGTVLFVADRADGRIAAYDLETRSLLRTLDTGTGPDRLTALSWGPDDKLYFSDVGAGTVVRIEPD